ncbi:hypothetical protein [Pseudomonas aeruginosa]|nr:hypothetical protein [Pseudomonas aeruginosa]MDI6671810.1 hypothetical protein [Pseudomonas aeruginosa]
MINETTYAGISVPKSLMEQCKALIAIKAFRAETGCSLQNARRALEL